MSHHFYEAKSHSIPAGVVDTLSIVMRQKSRPRYDAYMITLLIYTTVKHVVIDITVEMLEYFVVTISRYAVLSEVNSLAFYENVPNKNIGRRAPSSSD